MKAKKTAFYVLAALMAGCVPVASLHPLFTKETLVFEEKLLGTWVEDSNKPEITWEFARLDAATVENLPKQLQDEVGKLYRLNVTDNEGRKGVLIACLVKLKDGLFLDVLADKFPSGDYDPEKMKLVYNAFFFLSVHTFVRIDALGDKLKLRLTDDDGFRKLIEAEPKAVKCETVEERIILTASTEELQAFMIKYAADERLFPNDVTLTRKSK